MRKKMKNKNIAFYLGDFKRSGGTERSCIAVANGLAEYTAHTVFLFVTNEESDKSFFEISPSVKIVYLKITSLKKEYIRLSSRLMTALKIHKIDIIVAVEVMSLLFLMPVFMSKILARTKIKIFVWEHFNFTVSLNKKSRVYLRKFAARFADAIIVLTQQDIQLWKSNLNVRATMKSINNPSPFPVSIRPYEIMSRNIIAVGRLTFQKGFDRLLTIWEEFKKRNPHSEWKLQIIGSGPDESELKSQAKVLKVDDSVEWVANTPNVKSYYENAAFLAMTSRFEGLPMTLIEAQSFGLPIIAYKCLTGPEEVISDRSGFLVEKDNMNDYVEYLSLLCTDNERRGKMSKYAKEEVLRFFLPNIIDKWETLINNS